MKALQVVTFCVDLATTAMSCAVILALWLLIGTAMHTAFGIDMILFVFGAVLTAGRLKL